MTRLLRSCRAWFLSWVDHALIRGIPGRHTGQAHDALFSALAVSRQSQVAFVGAKQDVRKCLLLLFGTLRFGPGTGLVLLPNLLRC